MMIIKKFLSSRESKVSTPKEISPEQNSEQSEIILPEIIHADEVTEVDGNKDSYALEADTYNNKEQFAETVLGEEGEESEVISIDPASEESLSAVGNIAEGEKRDDSPRRDNRSGDNRGNNRGDRSRNNSRDNFRDDSPRNGGSRQPDDFEEPEQSPRETQIKSVKEFFNIEVLYRFDILEPDEKEKIRGTYQISLNGNNGGDWFVSVNDDIKVENSKNPADVSLSMSERDFMNIVNGHINPQLAILARKVLVKGDHKKAVYVNCLLAPERD